MYMCYVHVLQLVLPLLGGGGEGTLSCTGVKHIYSEIACTCTSFFLPVQIEHRSLTLGEVLDGDRMAVALYNVSFKESFDRKVLCTTSLNRAELEHLQEAIEDLYYFEFVYGTCVHNTRTSAGFVRVGLHNCNGDILLIGDPVIWLVVWPELD